MLALGANMASVCDQLFLNIIIVKREMGVKYANLYLNKEQNEIKSVYLYATF